MIDSVKIESYPVLFPEVLEESREEQDLVLILRIPRELAYFNGHFEEIPVVPGVVQVQWAVHYARRHFGLRGDLNYMEVIKFKELLMPGQRLELCLSYKHGQARLKFNYRSETADYSSGRIYFHDEAV